MEIPRLKQLLQPSYIQVFGYFFISLFALVILNFQAVTVKIERHLGLSLQPAWKSVGSEVRQNLPHNVLIDRLVLVLFWACVGLIVYFVTLAIVNIVIEAEDEVKLSKDYINHGDASRRLGTVVQLVLAAALILLLLASGFLLYPLWLQFFLKALEQFPAIAAFGWGLVAWLGFSLNLYLVHKLAKLVFAAA